jgi:hypothetical protein
MPKRTLYSTSGKKKLLIDNDNCKILAGFKGAQVADPKTEKVFFLFNIFILVLDSPKIIIVSQK